MQARNKKGDCMSLSLQGEKSLIAADTVVALPTRSDARGRADEEKKKKKKIAPFALRRNSSGATTIPACGAIPPSTIHLIASHT